MTVYVFGNEDLKSDCQALQAANFLKGKIPEINFNVVAPNDDVLFSDNAVIMDVVAGIKKVTLIKNIDKLVLNKSTTVHDFDLGFQLKYLKKLGKIKKVTIIGIPMGGKPDYLRIQLILRKLVEQDIQGS